MVRARKALAGASVLIALVLTTGIPVTHEADHDDGHSHIENAHGGHGYLVVLETGRVTAEHATVTAIQISPIRTLDVDRGVPARTPRPLDAVLHAGRGPPTPLLPRGPPPSHI